MRAIALGFALVACTPHHTTEVTRVPEAGVAIALYDKGDGTAYGVVDDRRWVELTGAELVLDHIDPGAALASLVIEPLGAIGVQIDRCTREHVPEPPPLPIATTPSPPQIELTTSDEAAALIEAERLRQRRIHGTIRVTTVTVTGDTVDPRVRCTARGAPGRYLVRVLYVSTTLTYRAHHDVVMTAPDRATVTTHFAVTTAAWNERAELALFDGIPGGERPPREVAHGTAILDGSIAILEVAPRDVTAALRRVYDGAIATPGLGAADSNWNASWVTSVWVWLELPKLRLAPGPLRVHVDLPGEGLHEIEVPALGRRQAIHTDAPLRLPLWIDETLVGTRQRFEDLTEGAQLAERVTLTVMNTGETPREVWAEEHTRPSRRRKVERAWPGKPTAAGDLLRTRLVVRAHKVERTGYTIAYDL